MIPASMHAIDLEYEPGAGHGPLDEFAKSTVEQWMLDPANGVVSAPTNCANLPEA